MKEQYSEEYSEQDWLDDLFSSKESQRTVIVAKTSLKCFDQFCESQGVTRKEMIARYKDWYSNISV